MTDYKRQKWDSWYEFLLSCIGCVIGLGNIWRFPYVCFKNGGGAFLVPYFLFLIILGFPVMHTEMAYSQWSNLGPGRVWLCCPLFKGIGFGMIFMTGIVCIYYNVIIAWTVYYLIYSFSSNIPWSNCDNDYNTKACFVREHLQNTSFNMSDVTNHTSKTPTEEFWEKKVLEITGGIQYIGTVKWELVLCLLVAWIAVFLCLAKGIKSSGKVMYIAVTVPYIFLITLLIRGLFLEGSVDGLMYFITPRWEKLFNFSVWGDAAVQVFFSLGLGWGGVATLASYNKFNHNFKKDVIIILIVEGMTSSLSGCITFITLGYMANYAGVLIDDIVSEGPGIAFLVYPEALSTLPYPQIWSVLFFLLLFTVGLDSQMVQIQTITGGIFDVFHSTNNRKGLVTAVVCFIGFLLGLICTTQGGIYILQLIDWYVTSISIMLLVVLEISVLSWIYGIERLNENISMMTGTSPGKIWKILLCFTTPSIIFLVWLFSIVKHTSVRYGTYTYPEWSIVIGWLIASVSLLPVPVGIIVAVLTENGTIIQRFRRLLRPEPSWKPANDEDINGAVLTVYTDSSL